MNARLEREEPFVVRACTARRWQWGHVRNVIGPTIQVLHSAVGVWKKIDLNVPPARNVQKLTACAVYVINIQYGPCEPRAIVPLVRKKFGRAGAFILPLVNMNRFTRIKVDAVRCGSMGNVLRAHLSLTTATRLAESVGCCAARTIGAWA